MSALTAVTVTMPCGEYAERADAGNPREYTGFKVGVFFVHHYISDDEIGAMVSDPPSDNDAWTVTHLPTGVAVQKRIPTHSRAIWLATKLRDFHGFNMETADEVRAVLRPHRPQIDVLRADAVSGDCQGLKP